MASWIKWLLPSALTAAGLTVVAGALTFRPIADDVVTRTIAQLKADGLDWATVSTRGRDLSLAGDAPDPEARIRALETADRVFGVRVVADATTVLPLAAPYAFSASRDGNKITLEGCVPSEAVRKAVLAAVAAAVPGAVIVDGLTLARGAGKTFAAASTFAIGQLSGLTRGKVALSDSAYSIDGDPVDWATYEKLEASLVYARPAGLEVAKDGLVAPVPSPYRLGLKISGGVVSLDGYLPDASSRDRLLAAVKRLWPGEIADATKIVPGARAGFLDALLAALPGLARLADGRLEISDATLKISGAAPTGALGDQIRAWIVAHLPEGFALGGAELAVVPPPAVAPDECRAGLGAVQANGKIRFETGKANLDTDDIRVLDTLVIAALRCGTAKVIVEGHTDNVGDPDANLALSDKRAAAVVDYLVAAGVAGERLKAVGFGDTRPVADNGSEDGRQMNRRIDFSVE